LQRHLANELPPCGIRGCVDLNTFLLRDERSIWAIFLIPLLRLLKQSSPQIIVIASDPLPHVLRFFLVVAAAALCHAWTVHPLDVGASTKLPPFFSNLLMELGRPKHSREEQDVASVSTENLDEPACSGIRNQSVRVRIPVKEEIINAP